MMHWLGMQCSISSVATPHWPLHLFHALTKPYSAHVLSICIWICTCISTCIRFDICIFLQCLNLLPITANYFSDHKGSHPLRKVQFFLTFFKRPLTPPPPFVWTSCRICSECREWKFDILFDVPILPSNSTINASKVPFHANFMSNLISQNGPGGPGGPGGQP